MKIKTIGILILIAFFIASVVTSNVYIKKYQKEKLKKEAAESTVFQLLDNKNSYITANLALKKALQLTSLKVDSLAGKLSIKPKNIVKIVYKEIIQHDTIKKEVPVYIIGKDSWTIEDIDKCFTYRANAYLWNDSLNVERTSFNYNNTVYDIFWWKRKFPIFGRKRFYQESRPECGTSFTKEVIFTKK